MSRWDTPTRPCPYCKEECEADWVDVEVGMIQCGPYYCMSCFASQIGPYDCPRELTDQEKKFGWYKPGSPCGSSANAVDGIPIDHKTALNLYQVEHQLGIQILDKVLVRSPDDEKL